MSRTLTVVVVLALCLLTLAGICAGSPLCPAYYESRDAQHINGAAVQAGADTADAVDTIPSYVINLLTLVNQQRALNGLNPLCLNMKLVKAAQDHSNWMASNRIMSHTGAGGSTPADRVNAVRFNWMSIGENVAWNQRSEREVMTAWMNSPGHRANILGDFKYFGAGMRSWYWCQLFANGYMEQCTDVGSVANTTTTTTTTTVAPTSVSGQSRVTVTVTQPPVTYVSYLFSTVTQIQQWNWFLKTDEAADASDE